MSAVRTGLFYWLQIFLVPLFLLSCLVPRKQELWVYGSSFGKRFADNPKYFYLYMVKHHADVVHSVWITKDKCLFRKLRGCGLPVLYLYSWEGIRTCLTAGVYFYDNYTKDISFCLSGRAVKVNLWHGIPLKKINLDNRFDRVRHPQGGREQLYWALRRMSDEKPSHYVLATSEFMRPYFSSAFGTKHVLVGGYPRNDALPEEGKDIWWRGLNLRETMAAGMLPEEKAALQRLEGRKEAEGRKMLLYMPTFRSSEDKVLSVLDWCRFQRFLEENKLLFVVKLHPKSAQAALWKKAEGDSVMVLPADYDPYPFLRLADVLVTDYSSIYFDYLLLDRPIVFWDFDREEYLRESREFYFPYEAYTPGQKAATQQELEQAVRRALAWPGEYGGERRWLRERMFDKAKHCGSELLFRKVWHGLLGR